MSAADVGVVLASTLDPAEVRRRVRSGEWLRLRRGVVAVRSARTPLEQLAQRVWAAMLLLPPGTVACGPTAAAVWQLDRVAEDDGLVHLLLPRGVRHDRLLGCRLHEWSAGATTVVNGVPCTSLVRTCLDEAARLPVPAGVALLESALRHDPWLARQLAEGLAAMPARSRRNAPSALALSTGRSESALEALAWVLWHDHGLPMPEQQAEIRAAGRFVARVDFLWPDARLVVEVDGRAKYDDPREWQSEKQRQNRLVAMGYVVLRFTWADVVRRPEQVAAQVHRALAGRG